MAFGGFSILAIVHAVLAVLIIIELGIMAWVVDVTDGTVSSVNFQLYNSCWSLLFLAYLALVPIYLARFYHTMAALIIAVVLAIFWFAGSIAVAAWFGAPNCFTTGCHTTQAGIAFGFFIWAIFTAMAVIDGIGFLKGGARADTHKPGQPYPGV